MEWRQIAESSELRESRKNSSLPLLSQEGVKKSIWLFFTSFRRKPESSVFKPLAIRWTPVFTGVTAEIQFFIPSQERGGEEGNENDLLKMLEGSVFHGKPRG
jgi:hypothetical protein